MFKKTILSTYIALSLLGCSNQNNVVEISDSIFSSQKKSLIEKIIDNSIDVIKSKNKIEYITVFKDELGSDNLMDVYMLSYVDVKKDGITCDDYFVYENIATIDDFNMAISLEKRAVPVCDDSKNALFIRNMYNPSEDI